MKKTFLYNILQYHHSLILNESINIGILFIFSEGNNVKYVSGDLERVKLIYPNFETTIVEKITKGIIKKVESKKENYSLFSHLPDGIQIEEHQKLLRSDDSSLQFAETRKVIYPFDDIEKIIDEYSFLLLPSLTDSEIEESRKDDHYILKTYTTYLHQKIYNIDNLIGKDKIIESKGIKLKFDYAWKNGTMNLVKPISFDLKKDYLIQNKSVTYFGYLFKLKDYAEKNNIRYDLLVGQPQREELLNDYNRALETIQSAEAPVQIIPEQNLKEYSEETAYYLSKKLNELDEDPF